MRQQPCLARLRMPEVVRPGERGCLGQARDAGASSAVHLRAGSEAAVEGIGAAGRRRAGSEGPSYVKLKVLRGRFALTRAQ